MKHNHVSDLEVNRIVRVVLVRHHIDLGLLSHQACRGFVHIQGRLELVSGRSAVLTSSLVGSIFDEIEHARGVCGLNIELKNWRLDNGTKIWRRLREVVRLNPQGRSSSGLNVFEIPDQEIREFAAFANV